MSLKSNLKTLDELVTKGKFIEAVDQFFADDVISRHENQQIVEGKAKKVEGLNHFLNVLDTINEITLHDSAATKNETFSLYTFDFTQKGGYQLTWNEVIRRVWKDGLVVEEEYLLAETAAEAKDLFKATVPSKKAATKRKPATKKTTNSTAKKTAETKKATVAKKAASKKATTKKVNATDDLRKIEGIGPKIATLLAEAGISTFEKLSKTKSDSVKEILLAAGSRYRMHDPATWAKQAQIAAKGKWEELKKWQNELKGGKPAK